MAIKKKIGNKRAAFKTRKNVGKCRDTRGPMIIKSLGLPSLQGEVRAKLPYLQRQS